MSLPLLSLPRQFRPRQSRPIISRAILACLFITGFAPCALANATPPMPKPLSEQAARGAQVYYLGHYDTLDSWMMIRGGQPEFYYATPNNEALVMGLLFSKDGIIQTTEQLKNLNTAQQTSVADLMASQARARALADAAGAMNPDDPVLEPSIRDNAVTAPAPAPAPAQAPTAQAPTAQAAAPGSVLPLGNGLIIPVNPTPNPANPDDPINKKLPVMPSVRAVMDEPPLANGATPNEAPAPSSATPEPMVKTGLAAPIRDVANTIEPATPAVKMFLEVSNAAAVHWGQPDAPVFYALIDPNCSHCQNFLQDAEPLVDAGTISIKIIPVGFDDISRRQAAFVISSGDGIKSLLRYSKGDTVALPSPEDLNTAAIATNTDLITRWNFMATPVIIYRAGKTNEVRLIRGRPTDLAAAVSDLRGQ